MSPFDGFGFGGDGFNIGGGIGGGVGGALGGPIGAAIGAWAGKSLGGIIRGRRSPEQFVNDMIAEGRIPQFLASVVTKDRLIATERQSRGAGWVLDRMKEDIEITVSRVEAENWDYALSELTTAEGNNRRFASERPDSALASLLMADVDRAIISMVGEARQGGAGGGGSFPPPPGAGGSGGGTAFRDPGGGGGINKAAIGIIAGVVILGMVLSSK